MRFALEGRNHQSIELAVSLTPAPPGQTGMAQGTAPQLSSRGFQRTITIATILVALLFEIPVHASDRSLQMRRDDPQTLVLILSSRPNAHRIARLADTLTAHLNTLPVTLEIMRRAHFEAFDGASAEASMILWLNNSGDTLNILIPELSKMPRQVNIDGTKAGSQAWFDALAVIIYSEVSGVVPIPDFEPEDQSVETKADEPHEPVPTSDEAKTEQPSNRIEVAVTPASSKRKPKKDPVWLGLQASYAPSWPIANRSAQHGTRLGAALCFFKYWVTDISFEVLPAYQNNAGGDQVRLRRWPLRLMMRGHLPLRSFFVAAGIGLFIDMSRIDGLDGELRQGDADHVQAVFGTTLLLSTGYWVNKWLGVMAQGGIDVASKSVRYTIQDKVTMSLRLVRPAISLGVTLRWSVVEGH